ncbi:LysR family transcriptional regulator [Micromonospora sp. NBC_00898]|uniref:LysR family transcriptional regulator n=1 Tax=Micromonospora sp. NBC_00898 TaxID=2975981 RepID=UPI003862E7D0|nr:LysR family transcriptional regulator [Micromonospora sp. NBC_00898]
MIDPHRLRILEAVALHGSFSRAAATLRLTPSAVSQQIAALERSVGTAVVARSTRGVTLTEAGRLLVDAAAAISAELRQAQAQIDRLAGPLRLTIATFSSGGRHLLPAVLTRFVAAHPDVEVNVVEMEPESSLPAVRDGAADLAVAYQFDGPLPGRAGDRSGLEWTPLLADPLSVVTPRNHRLAGKESVDLVDLADERWVLGCRRTEAYLRRFAALAGFEARFAGSTSDYFFAQLLVGAGVGVSLIPEIALLPSAPELAVIPLEPPRPTRHIGVVTARRRRPRPEVDLLVTELGAAAGAPHRTGSVHL